MKLPAGAKREIVFIAVVLAVCGALYLAPSTPQLLSQRGTTATARVLSVDNANLQQHGLVRAGSQLLEVEILDGDLTGKRFRAGNELRGQPELDKEFRVGDTAVVAIPAEVDPASTMLTARDHYRNGWGIVLFGGFCILLCVFGSWTGVKALFSFVFSCLAIWKLVIPLVLRGYSASWVIFGAVALLTAVIVWLVAGLSRKGVAAFAGSALGVLAGLGMAHGFGRLMHINGATLPYVQTLLYSGYETLDLPDIFIGATILAGSGAVMDLAMDIAAGVEEVARHNPRLSARELALSGIRIGRSVVGTMTTTLLLAYSGGYLSLLMVFASQGTPVSEFLNSQLVAAETVKTLIGSFALILVAPFTAAVAGWVFRSRTMRGFMYYRRHLRRRSLRAKMSRIVRTAEENASK